MVVLRQIIITFCRHQVISFTRHIPASEVRDTLQLARDLPDDLTIEEVCARIGNGSHISAQVGWEGIPTALRQAREPLPDWLPLL